MLFTTLPFWALFIVFLLIFAVLRRFTTMGMMLYVVAFSLGFYTLATGVQMVVLPAVAIVTWYGTRWMRSLQGRARRRMLGNLIFLDLIPLLLFKYAGAALDLWRTMVDSNFALSTIAMPVGVSFFTFQAISYTVDVYRGRFRDDVTLLQFFFYLTFFPLLFAGPITRAEHFFAHFRSDRLDARGRLLPVSQRLLYAGLWLVMLGLVKKMVVADYIAQYNDWIFDDPLAYSGWENLMGVVGYSVQIYCDFSGYSDLSLGIAALMGIRLPENFNLPYQSLNVTEFWRRWHISLSTWFRDYLYIPLGGNRCGRWRTLGGVFVTMLVAGVWHGSSLMFLLWGAVHGLALALHKALQPLLRRVPTNWLTRPLAWLLTFAFVSLAWVIFRADSLESSMLIFRQIFTHMDLSYVIPFVATRPLWTALVVGSLLVHATRREAHHRTIRWYALSPFVFKVLLFAAVVQLCIQMHTSNVQPFIYCQF